MASSSAMSASIANAITFLTRPLITTHSATTVVKLQLLLEANLTTHFAGSSLQSRRCLTLSPACLPPRPIYASCLAAGIQWPQWMAALGSFEFDLIIEPGRVSVRRASVTTIIWSAPESLPLPQLKKTFAQQLIEEDSSDEDEIFAMIAHRVSVSVTAPTPVYASFPSTRSPSPVSRPSSGASFSSSNSASASDYSFASSGASSSSNSSLGGSSSSGFPSEGKRSRKARKESLYVDKSKTTVTPYDGGRTTVLTGGVMLGAKPSPQPTESVPYYPQPNGAVPPHPYSYGPAPTGFNQWRR